MAERREVSTYRQIKDHHITGDFQGTIEMVTFPNPGEAPILQFHNQYYWHEPITNEAGETVGHKLEWSLLPNKYKAMIVGMRMGSEMCVGK